MIDGDQQKRRRKAVDWLPQGVGEDVANASVHLTAAIELDSKRELLGCGVSLTREHTWARAASVRPGKPAAASSTQSGADRNAKSIEAEDAYRVGSAALHAS